MAIPIIEIQCIGKRYRIGAAKEKYLSLRDEVAKWLSPAARRAKAAEKEFWALKDVSFSVEPGEAVGIIGRNGAGKSTLLKILSQITPPTEGTITMRGRVGSLLEVGTGFHPELTGRENIYMNGAILGMSRKEIARKFDDIVLFAEMKQFLDTPVKRYSSGMYVRLAFAVAAHLEPEILIVDEVLAVGDAEFQKKCLGKMREVAKGGRTVVFVSHNMAAVAVLCSRGIVLDEGRLSYAGTIAGATQHYHRRTKVLAPTCLSERKDRLGTGQLRFAEFWCEDADGRRIASAVLGKKATLCFAYQAKSRIQNVSVAFNLRDQSGTILVNCNTADTGTDYATVPPSGILKCVLPVFPLRPGIYHGALYAKVNGEVADWLQEAISVDVVEGDFYGTGKLSSQGAVLVPHTWTVMTDGRMPPEV